MWVRVEDTLPSHRKTKKLARILKIPQMSAVGHLVSLWLWCATNVPDGDLSILDEDDIAEAALWSKKGKTFVEALVSAGFLDSDYKIHDWLDFAGKLLEEQERTRVKNRERQAKYRERQREKKAGSVTPESPVCRTLGNERITGDITGDITSKFADVTGDSEQNNGLCNGNITPTYETKRDETLLSLSSSPLSDRERAILGGVCFLCQTLKGDALDSVEFAQIKTYWQEMGTAVIERAVDVARKSGKGFEYLLGILRRKQEQGVSCLADWDSIETIGKPKNDFKTEIRAFTGLED